MHYAWRNLPISCTLASPGRWMKMEQTAPPSPVCLCLLHTYDARAAFSDYGGFSTTPKRPGQADRGVLATVAGAGWWRCHVWQRERPALLLRLVRAAGRLLRAAGRPRLRLRPARSCNGLESYPSPQRVGSANRSSALDRASNTPGRWWDRVQMRHRNPVPRGTRSAERRLGRPRALDVRGERGPDGADLPS
jgi:hypothetical protein